MKKIDTDTKYAIISILLFVLVFTVAFSGSIDAFKVASELKKEKQTAFVNFGISNINKNEDRGGLNAAQQSDAQAEENDKLYKKLDDFNVCKDKKKCKDWCATSYVTAGKNAKEPQVYTCSIFNSKRDDEIARAIKGLSQDFSNIVEVLQGQSTPSKPNPDMLNANVLSSFSFTKYNDGDNYYSGFYKLLCVYENQKQYNENKKAFIKYLSALPIKLEYKKIIMSKIQNVEKLKAKWLKQPPASKTANKDDLKSCKFKGVVNCVLTPEASSKAVGLNKEDIVKSNKLSGNIFSCIPKNKKSSSVTTKPTTKPTTNNTAPGTQAPTITHPGVQRPTSPTRIPPTNPYAQQVNPYTSQRVPNIPVAQNYDPCRDPSYIERQNMGLFSGIMFNIGCVLRPNNQQSDSGGRRYDSAPQQIIPSCVLSLDKSSVKSGEKIKITWKSSNAQSATLSSSSAETLSGELNGELVLYPDESQTYTLTVTSKTGHSKTCSRSVTVTDNPVKLSCSPDVISKGSSLQVDWSCPAGFSLKDSNFGANEGSGSIAKTLDSSQELTVSCAKGDKTLSASCFVQVANPELEIIAYPLQVKRGEKARVSWAAVQMKSCRVMGPRGFDYTRNFAVALTTPFPTDDRIYSDAAIYTLKCQDKWGKTYSKDVTIRLLGDLDQVETQQNETASEPEINPSGEISTTIIKTSLDPKQCPHFTKYYKQGESGGEIAKIQTFLKDQGLYYGPIDGYYSEDLDRAVRAFQARYADEILKPWNLSAPTGYWYKTTRKKANYLAGCAEGAVVLDDGTVVY